MDSIRLERDVATWKRILDKLAKERPELIDTLLDEFVDTLYDKHNFITDDCV